MQSDIINVSRFVPGHLRKCGVECYFGGSPSAPKPPAPPSKDDASKSLLNQGKRKTNAGYASTILTGGSGDANATSSVKKLLGA